jgi:hypothetical protein
MFSLKNVTVHLQHRLPPSEIWHRKNFSTAISHVTALSQLIIQRRFGSLLEAFELFFAEALKDN